MSPLLQQQRMSPLLRLASRLPPTIWHVPLVVASSEATLRAAQHVENTYMTEGRIFGIDILPATFVLAAANILLFVILFDMFALNNHVYCSPSSEVRRKYPHALLLSGFNHSTPKHLIGNMWALYNFGVGAEAALSKRAFVYFYMIAIHASMYLNFAVFSKFLKREEGMSLGASGAISALESYVCLKFPHLELNLFGFLDLPAPIACVCLFFVEWWELRHNQESRIGHGAHLGGYVVGILFFAFREIIFADPFIWQYHKLSIQSIFDKKAKKRLDNLVLKKAGKLRMPHPSAAS